MNTDNLPLQNPDLILYSDGSSFVDKGERKAGWAVTTDSEVLASGALSPGTSEGSAAPKTGCGAEGESPPEGRF